MLKKLLMLITLACAACTHAAPLPTNANAPARPASLKVALTFDDLPAHGSLPRGTTRTQVIQGIVDALSAHHIERVMGFVNGASIDGDDAVQAMQLWLQAGHRIGNHTYSHARIEDVGLDAYLADIDRNDAVLQQLAQPYPAAGPHNFFRYPFLQQGGDLATRDAIRAHLALRRYRVAEVTVDFGDWAWNEPFARCAARDDARAIAALRRSYIDNALRFLQWADAAAQMIYARPIPHVLLLHVGAFNAAQLGALLDQYQANGVEFISVDEALADPIYALDTHDTANSSNSLLEQVISTQHAPHPPFLIQPLALLDALCR